MNSNIAADQQHVDASDNDSEHDPPLSETTDTGCFTCERRPTLHRRARLECSSPPMRPMPPLCVQAQYIWLVVSVVAIVFSVSITANDVVDHNAAAGGHYTHQWAVHIPGGHHVADQIAAAHGFVNMGKVSAIHVVVCFEVKLFGMVLIDIIQLVNSTGERQRKHV